MKTLFKNLLFLTFIIVSFTACKKDKESKNNQNVDLSGKLHKIISNGADLVVYSYDGSGKLKKKETNSNGLTLTVTYTYDNGKISKETTKHGGNTISEYTYSYLQNGKLDKCNIVGLDQTYWKMHYDNNNKMDYVVRYLSGGESLKMSFTYTGDNITEVQSFNRFGGTWEMQERYEFEYDNKHNPEYDLNRPFSETIDEISHIFCPNNLTRVKEYDQSNNLVKDTQYQYNYNGDNYPTSVTEDNTDTYEIIYY